MQGGLEAIYEDLPKPIGFMRFGPVKFARGAIFGTTNAPPHQSRKPGRSLANKIYTVHRNKLRTTHAGRAQSASHALSHCQNRVSFVVNVVPIRGV